MPLPLPGTPERREYMRMIGRRGGLATAAKKRAQIEGNLIAVLTDIANQIAEEARNNVHRNGLPSDIADAIQLGSVTKTADGIEIKLIVDLGNPSALGEARQARSAARAFEYGSGEHATRRAGGTYPIAPRESPVLAFEWPGHSEDFPPGPKFIYAEDGIFIFRYVDHPGVEARPYIRPAIETFKGALKASLGKAFKDSWVEPDFQIDVKV